MTTKYVGQRVRLGDLLPDEAFRFTQNGGGYRYYVASTNPLRIATYADCQAHEYPHPDTVVSRAQPDRISDWLPELPEGV